MFWYMNVSGRDIRDGNKIIRDGETFEITPKSDLFRTGLHDWRKIDMLVYEKLVVPVPCVPAPRDEWDSDLKARATSKAQDEVAVSYDRWDFL